MSSVESSFKDLKAPVQPKDELELGTGTTTTLPGTVELPWSGQYKALWACKRSVFASFACSSAAVLIGYDLYLIGSIIANPTFVEYFGVYDESIQAWALPADRQLVWSIVQYCSAMVGALVSRLLDDMFGKKLNFHCLIACVDILKNHLTMAGTLVELLSPNWLVWIVAKILFGAAMGQMQGTIPSYIAELAPTHIRGSCVLKGTTSVSGNWSWKGAVVSQFAIGTICLALFIPLVLESPYYLVGRGKTDQARQVLQRLRGSERDYEVDRDVASIKATLDHERQARSEAVSYFECFQGTNLRRTLIACLPMAMQHFMGYPLAGNYQAYFLSLSGFEDSFLIGIVSMLIGMIAIIGAFTMIEKTGRRPQLIYGSIGLCSCLLIIGILDFINPSSKSSSTAVAVFCILWSVFYYASLGAVGWTIPGEVPSARLRSKTTSIAGFTNSLINMGWSIAVPYLVNKENANLGAKTGLVFFGPSVVLLVVAWVSVPETKGKSFAELDELFERKTSARKFRVSVT
ncbi:hypothetical protein SLS60_004334 [Paraconiothyrium brasiliense]|uniref:Major facilitator superfamily (MFS) profile domain-containing protein n=1 Tax=Paraconiothyrium brasiliense TaxID=300254 RepID=A0ABR3RK13_9PLEO